MIGRYQEKKHLLRLFKDKKSHFLAVFGRRRIGKTYLIRNYFADKMSFYHTGLSNTGLALQLDNFYLSLVKYGYQSSEKPKNWLQAFEILKQLLDQNPSEKKVVFMDELPWLDSPRSAFLASFENFWNTWASARKDILLIVCGSASSWMIHHLLNNKKGLHNRVTSQMKLLPFDIKETREFLESNHIQWDSVQIAKAYMVLGGIPYYLEQLQSGKSIDQNIDELFYAPNGHLRHEYYNLFASLYDKPELYMQIMQLLSQKSKGFTRGDLLSKLKIKTGGHFSKVLEELVLSDFIQKYIPYGKKERDALYKLQDFFCHFYLTFIQNQNTTRGEWLSTIMSGKTNAWSGYAFERFCHYHIDKIKAVLGISGVLTKASSWRNESIQIDLLLERQDQIINLIEVKYSLNDYTITKLYAKELLNKVEVFRQATKTKKAIHLTLITTQYLIENEYSGYIQNHIKLDDLLN